MFFWLEFPNCMHAIPPITTLATMYYSHTHCFFSLLWLSPLVHFPVLCFFTMPHHLASRSVCLPQHSWLWVGFMPLTTCSWLYITSGCTLLTLFHWGCPSTTSYWVSVGLKTLKSVANSPQALSVCYSWGLFPTFLCCMIDLSPAVSCWVPVVGEALIHLIFWCVTSPQFSILTLLINWMLTLLD